MSKPYKKHAPLPEYVSDRQLQIDGFDTPFSQHLDPDNRWVVLEKQIPWDELSGIYLKQFKPKTTGRPPLNPRLVMGSIIIKHMCNLDDREAVAQISENMYMQYFLGYSSFSSRPPFDASLFVEFRHRLGEEVINEMNERILAISQKPDITKSDENLPCDPGNPDQVDHKGTVIMDATACPQDIAYPTDLNLLSKGREISERLIDKVYDKSVHQKKPRTYRQIARKEYLKTAQKKVAHRKVWRKAVGKQLRYLNRNIKSLNQLLDKCRGFPLDKKEHKYLMVLHSLYQQQLEMYNEHKHSIADRIVSLHQPHVRPIVRGKLKAKVEFGAKIHLSLVEGYAFLDTISWDAFNEGSSMIQYIEAYKTRFDCYPKEVLADKIYCTRENRKQLKLLNIKLLAKPLGRPKAVEHHLRPGERNPIEGKFGQAKNAYGLNRIRARLSNTSQSWIASIILVLNLVKLAGQVPLWLSFSAWIRHLIQCIIFEKIREQKTTLGFS
jgi:hypothetical protein